MSETKHIARFGLSGFVLKVIALTSMTADHIGYMLFPSAEWLRIIGRLAFPIFAYVLAEGCRYTRNPYRRLIIITALGVICEIVYGIYSGGWYGNIMLQLAVSVGLLTLLKEGKKALFGEVVNKKNAVIYFASFAFGVVGAGVFCHFVGFDYGFAGVMTPVLVGLFDFRSLNPPELLKKLDNFFLRLALFAGALVWLSLSMRMTVQPWCLLALVPIALYNETPGKIKLKYFFYLYYPLHLLIIAGISFLV